MWGSWRTRGISASCRPNGLVSRASESSAPMAKSVSSDRIMVSGGGGASHSKRMMLSMPRDLSWEEGKGGERKRGRRRKRGERGKRGEEGKRERID